MTVERIKNKSLIPVFALMAILGLNLVAMAFMQTKAPVFAKELPLLEANILKVGQADVIMLTEDNQALVIDAGEEEDGVELVEELSKKGITQVETLIITHFDKDHVGGADVLLEKMPVNNVIMPDYVGTSTEYTDFISALEKKSEDSKINVSRLTEDVSIEFGSSKVLIEAPSSYEIPKGNVEYDNDFSLITTVSHGENVLLFMGDAEKKLTREWLAKGYKVDCDFIKMPHHGVYTSSTLELLEATKPEYAAMCTSDKNPAEDKTLELIRGVGATALETRNGDITISSDGISIKVVQ